MPSRRRLAAILMADIAGFTRLMATDEDGTTARVVDMHSRVRAAVEDHGGRVVSTAGDSVFGLFDSVVEAFECGRRIQEEAAKDQEPLPRGDRIALRMGLHVGDVIEEGEDVFGEGVNIASRLEEMSEPGGLAVSGAVHDQIGARVELDFEDHGERSLRGIGRRVRVHTLSAEALGGEGLPTGVDEGDDLEVARDAMRRAAEVVARGREGRGDDGERSVVRAVFGVGNLTVLAIGLLAMIPEVTDASPSGLWTTVGGALTGLGVGMVLSDATGRRGLLGVFLGIGTGIGASWLGNQIVRAAVWVSAAGMLGAGIEAFRRGRSADS
jgi:class 3 adenylate cyclase